MRTAFSWKSDSTEVNVQSGIAKWDINGNFVQLRFNTFNEAVLMDNLLHKTYNLGFREGMGKVANAISHTLNECTSY